MSEHDLVSVTVVIAYMYLIGKSAWKSQSLWFLPAFLTCTKQSNCRQIYVSIEFKIKEKTEKLAYILPPSQN